MNVLRLYPLPTRETPGLYEDLNLPPSEHRDATKPYVIINMVSSVDGRATAEGKAGRIGSETDRRAMRTLRSKAEAVMIGAGTLRAERISLGLDDPAGPQPLAVVVTNSGNMSLERNLIVVGRQEVLIIAPHDVTVRRPSERHVLRISEDRSGNVDLAEALNVLKAAYAVDLLLVEGGPRLIHSLISQDLADEVFLTLAPKLLGGTTGEALAILEGPQLSSGSRPLELLSVFFAAGELFLRYELLSHNTHTEY